METEFSSVIMQGLFLKVVGFTYLLAFVSLIREVKGLYGSKGILPVQSYLDHLRRSYKGKKIYFQLPTIFWFDASDRILTLSCWGGIIVSFVAMMGFFPSLSLLLAWILYSSFCRVGSPFLNFQWDTLLLEVGFIALLFGVQTPPPILIIYLLWFLLFRFMLSSGLTKLLYGSKEWKNLTATDFHYETQPLPTVLGYYAHHLPKVWSRLSILLVYGFEILLPFFIFTSDLARLIVFCLLATFQILISLTGNFAFFNLLSVALCIPLLDDTYLQYFARWSHFTPLINHSLYVEWVLNGIGGFLIFLNVLELSSLFTNLGRINRIGDPFRFFNLLHSYGLFVHMTIERNEIIIEGSEDQQVWTPYEFQWKPGNPLGKPCWIAPLQPRLDWQMWFAALSSYEKNRWFQQFLLRLLEGSEDVLMLLKHNPFPKPPKYIRGVIYRYRFTDLKTKKETGAWWTREFLGQYSPIYTRQKK